MSTRAEERELYSKKFNTYVLNTYKGEYIVIGDYSSSLKPIYMMHTTCGNMWYTTPNRFKDLHKLCPECSGNKYKNKVAKENFYKYFSTEAKDYTLLSEYKTTMQPVYILHNTCGTIWSVMPNDFKGKGTRCPHCSRNYSRISIDWLNTLSTTLNIYIQHQENDGEYNIPNTKYFVDGYCKDYNLVFEFHGDLFHGGLVDGTILNNPFTKEPGESAFQRTIDRMEDIERLGYSIFYVFENDWNSGHIGDFFGKHLWARI